MENDAFRYSPAQNIEVLGIASYDAMSLELLFVLLSCCFQFHAGGQFGSLLIRSKEHINHTAENDDGS